MSGQAITRPNEADRGIAEARVATKSQKPRIEGIVETAYRAGRIARRDRERLVKRGIPMRNPDPRMDPLGRRWCKEFVRRMHAGQEERWAWERGWSDAAPLRR